MSVGLISALPPNSEATGRTFWFVWNATPPPSRTLTVLPATPADNRYNRHRPKSCTIYYRRRADGLIAGLLRPGLGHWRPLVNFPASKPLIPAIARALDALVNMRRIKNKKLGWGRSSLNCCKAADQDLNLPRRSWLTGKKLKNPVYLLRLKWIKEGDDAATDASKEVSADCISKMTVVMKSITY
jgi:hypothetical protein